MLSRPSQAKPVSNGSLRPRKHANPERTTSIQGDCEPRNCRAVRASPPRFVPFVATPDTRLVSAHRLQKKRRPPQKGVRPAHQSTSFGGATKPEPRRSRCGVRELAPDSSLEERVAWAQCERRNKVTSVSPSEAPRAPSTAGRQA